VIRCHGTYGSCILTYVPKGKEGGREVPRSADIQKCRRERAAWRRDDMADSGSKGKRSMVLHYIGQKPGGLTIGTPEFEGVWFGEAG
jgi:hypothetical protein